MPFEFDIMEPMPPFTLPLRRLLGVELIGLPYPEPAAAK